MRSKSLIIFAAVLLALVSPANALTIDFIYDPADPVLSNPKALAAAKAAAMGWIDRLADNVTVKIELKAVDFGGIDANGRTSFGYTPQTLTHSSLTSYDLMRNAMISDENAESDTNSIVAKLPTLSQFRSDIPNKLTAWNVLDEIWSTSANLKALGYAYPSTHIDATIEFNTNRKWDFNRENGVVPPQNDFQAMLTHEIGHVLGFQSAIDQFNGWYLVDRGEWESESLGKPFPFTDIAPMTLDMFRFGYSDRPTSSADFTNKKRNLNPFVEDITVAYLVLHDTNWTAYEMEPGYWVNQDQTPRGRQASHWKNHPSGSEMGIMDASMPAGMGPDIKNPDWHAMDVIGWDVVVQSTGGGVRWNGVDASPPSPPTNLHVIE